MRVVVVGCGGIGYHLLDPLMRVLLAYPTNHVHISFVDGKIITPRNVNRQHLSSFIGRNKAEALAMIAKSLIPREYEEKIQISAIPEYVSPEYLDCHPWLSEDEVHVFSGVDNNKTRMMLENILGKNKTLVFVSGGNDEFTGQAILWVRQKFQDVLPRPSHVDPDIAEEQNAGVAPYEVSCDAVPILLPQFPLVNRVVADAMVGLWWAYAKNKTTEINYTVVDILQPMIKPTKRRSLLTQ